MTKLLVEAGQACAAYHHETVRNVKAERVQCDEIWSLAYAKARNLKGAKAAPEGSGDVWTWTALDADTKLIVTWLVGDRSHGDGLEFMADLRERLANKVQLTTDAHRAYLSAVKELDFDADYAMLIKHFGPSPGGTGHYSPPVCTGISKRVAKGSPDPAHISTSYVERQNLSMRMGMRRFTRLTNAFSKKVQNHMYALSLYFVHYNFCRIHKTLRVSPAMAAGLSDTLRDMEWVVCLIDARAEKPGKRGPYKKRLPA